MGLDGHAVILQHPSAPAYSAHNSGDYLLLRQTKVERQPQTAHPAVPTHHCGQCTKSLNTLHKSATHGDTSIYFSAKATFAEDNH